MIVTNPHLQSSSLFIGFMCQNIDSSSFYVPYLFWLAVYGYVMLFGYLQLPHC